jgi:hypothetical protein|tara:strand:- start:768 stop:1196 length:429 start_codon:yes stop_codon:yes gene_type:complete
MTDNFYLVSDDTITDFFEVFEKKAFPISIEIQFMGAKKQKQLIKISKIADILVLALGGKELLVSINEDLMDAFDEESRTILIEQEINKINMNMTTGKIKIAQTTRLDLDMINKYGIEKVGRANQVESLLVEQTDDQNSEFIA